MQLRQRIKKLESVTTHKNGGYCSCYIKPKYEVVTFPISEYRKRFEAGETDLEKLPDYCDKCKKPVDKSCIELTFEQMQANVSARINQVAETWAKHN